MNYQTAEQLLAVRKQAIEKYAPFLEGISNEDTKGVVAQMLENQRQLMAVREADITNTDVPTSVFPVKFAFPLIAQVFPAIVAQELFAVTSMNAPTGRVFYKGYVHQGDSASFSHSGSYSKNTETGTVKRGRMRFTHADVTAEKFILQAQWSTEVSEDLRALASLSVETDMMNALRDEIIGEIDWLILKDIMDQEAQLAGVVTAPAFGDYSYQGHIEHWNELKGALIDADVLVSKNRFQRTNYVIGQPGAVAKLRKVRDFKSAAPGGSKIGTQAVGTLDQWAVYENANFPVADKLLMGIKGEGYVYAPYIPLELMPAVYVPETDEWLRNVRTRAGRKLVVPKSLAVVDVSEIS